MRIIISRLLRDNANNKQALTQNSTLKTQNQAAKQNIALMSLLLMAACIAACIAACMTACAPAEPLPGPPLAAHEKAPAAADDGQAWLIRVIDAAGMEAWSFTEAELTRTLPNLDTLPAEQTAPLAHIYSTINNWPAPRFYAAEGYSAAAILQAAGLFDTAQTIIFRAADGYEVSFTREQLLSPQYYYPQVGVSAEGAGPVWPIIAYRWREGTEDLSDIYENKPSLIIGQRHPFEHSNPAFVVGITEILVDDAPCEAWPAATTFPLPGPIASGETVKLQHPSYGLVKLHYTLDGSEPTVLSPMYNPSTYQPELNRPYP